MHHHHMPAPWQEWTGKTAKDQQWMKQIAYFDNMKIVSLPPYGPVFQLWRNCPRSFSSSKTICLAHHLYKPISQLFEVSIPPLLKRQWFYLCEPGEDMKKWDGKPTSALQTQACELQESPSRKMAAPISRRQFSRQRRWSDLISEDDNEPSNSHTWEMSN